MMLSPPSCGFSTMGIRAAGIAAHVRFGSFRLRASPSPTLPAAPLQFSSDPLLRSFVSVSVPFASPSALSVPS
jgi:hypothetical protein